MNTMTYKGYLGSVAYSEKDQVFFGKIEGINGLVNFEGESVKELTEAFHEAVDDYLAYCEDEGMSVTIHSSTGCDVGPSGRINYQCLYQRHLGEKNQDCGDIVTRRGQALPCPF